MASLSLVPSMIVLHPSSPRICFQSTLIKIPLFNLRTPNLLIIRAHNPNQIPWSPSSSVVTDESVPEGHAGLHGLLYGDRGAQVHDGLDSPEASPQPIQDQDNGSSIIPINEYLNSKSSFKFGGVYAIYDSQNQIQYVGYSRNVVLSLKSHMDRVGHSLCCSVRVKMMFTDSSTVSRQTLEQEMNKWVQQYGAPPGNSDPTQRELWESGLKGAPIGVMSPEEKNVYHDKKFKLKKAMGENLYGDENEDDDDLRMRKVDLLKATQGDDWSAVIDGQTKKTLNRTQNSIDEKVVNPFSGQGTSGLYSAVIYDLTVENVNMVLNDVRPYLVADGGDVEVAGVEDGVISLRLQGACGTCPSSTTTMKMGIERVLKEKFGNALKEVRQVDQQEIGATVVSVNSHLDMLRPAIQNYGGSVEVLSVEDGDCHVKFNGPGSIGMGIQAAIKDKFPDITNVVLINS